MNLGYGLPAKGAPFPEPHGPDGPKYPPLGGGVDFWGCDGVQAAHHQAPPLATAGDATDASLPTPLKPKAGLCSFGHPVLPARLAS